jgi:hypothetical protein
VVFPPNTYLISAYIFLTQSHFEDFLIRYPTPQSHFAIIIILKIFS